VAVLDGVKDDVRVDVAEGIGVAVGLKDSALVVSPN
jgi:hypothetical protein